MINDNAFYLKVFYFQNFFDFEVCWRITIPCPCLDKQPHLTPLWFLSPLLITKYAREQFHCLAFINYTWLIKKRLYPNITSLSMQRRPLQNWGTKQSCCYSCRWSNWISKTSQNSIFFNTMFISTFYFFPQYLSNISSIYQYLINRTYSWWWSYWISKIMGQFDT